MRLRSASSSMRTSLTPRSSSVADTLDAHPFRVDDSRHRDDLVPAHDERPRLAFRAGNLRVDENVLDLLAPSSEPVARAPGSYLKAWELRLDAPRAPAHLALQRHGRALQPDAVVLTHRRQAAAEVEPLRADCGREQLVERRRTLLGETQKVPVRRGMQLAQARQDLVADQSPLRVGVRGID